MDARLCSWQAYQEGALTRALCVRRKGASKIQGAAEGALGQLQRNTFAIYQSAKNITGKVTPEPIYSLCLPRPGQAGHLLAWLAGEIFRLQVSCRGAHPAAGGAFSRERCSGGRQKNAGVVSASLISEGDHCLCRQRSLQPRDCTVRNISGASEICSEPHASELHVPDSHFALELCTDALTARAQHAIWKTARVDGPLLDAMLSVFAKARTACKLPPLSRQEVENTSLHEVFQRKEVCFLLPSVTAVIQW